MPIELVAAWLLREAYKLVVVPVASNLLQRFDNKLADNISSAVYKKFVQGRAQEACSGTALGTDADNGFQADKAFVEVIEQEPDAGEVLREEMESILKVSLDLEGASKGTDGWYVSAYEAILWRVGVLATWEQRPIAIEGALQGPQWLTVCVPYTRDTPAPVNMWRRPDTRTRLRSLRDQPVDFFVRQIEADNERRNELTALNDRFMISPAVPFAPGEEGSLAGRWHRLDGLQRKWVVLKPDAATQRTVNAQSPHFNGRPLFGHRNFDLHPLAFDDYPPEWTPLLRIPDEATGISALSAGADGFARVSSASAAAVEAVLQNL